MTTFLLGPAVLPAAAALAVTALGALAIRLLWRPRSTPWDA